MRSSRAARALLAPLALVALVAQVALWSAPAHAEAAGAAPARVVVIGLDAASWNVVRPLIDAGALPNLARLVEGGATGPLRSY